MTPDDPRHGTYRGWAQHDREGSDACEPCKDARRAYGRVAPHLRALGIPPRVPVGDHAHAIVSALADLTEREWNDHTGISPTTRRRVIAGGPTTVVRRTTRKQLEGIDPGRVREAMLTNVGCVRRVRALACLGHSATAVAKAAGVHPQTARMIQADRLVYVEYATRARIAAAYARLEFTRLPITHVTARAFNLAERSGWDAPAAWDRIDDPNERPQRAKDRWRRKTEIDPVIVDRLLQLQPVEHSTKAERHEAMRRWLAMGRSEKSLCDIHGWKDNRYGKEAA